MPADDKVVDDPSSNLPKQCHARDSPDVKPKKQLGSYQNPKILATGLSSTLPPGRPVLFDEAPSKKDRATNIGARIRASSGPPKPSRGRSRKSEPVQSCGLLVEAFRNAQVSRTGCLEETPKADNDIEGPTHGQAPIDLTGNNDDPIEEDVDSNVQLQIADALEKWYPELDKHSKREDMVLASTFLRFMNSTLCFLTVSFRMLSKAPWKSKMLTVHIRQAALAAIGNGWFVWSDKQHKIPFSRAELALAAVSFRGCLQPRMPDDPAQVIFPMIDLLPTNIGCEEMFSQGNCVCPYCGNQRAFAVPTFATAVTWKSPDWTTLQGALQEAEAFPWRTCDAWHQPDCNRDEVTVHVTKFGPWALLFFRPHDLSLYPPLQEMAIPLTDTSVTERKLKVGGFLCTDINGEHGYHYWFVEPCDNGAACVYDSLKGVQQLTVELSRTLYIVGVLLLSIDVDKPVLTNAKLGVAAGKVLLHHKNEKPIKVAARSRRQVPRKTKGCTGFKQRQGPGKGATKKNAAHPNRSALRAGKGEKNAGSPIRFRRGLRHENFRKRCTEDPDDPISEEDMGPRPCKQLRNTPEKAANCKPLACEHFQSGLDRAGKASPSVIRTCDGPNGGCPDEGAGVKSPAKGPIPETEKGLNGNCFPLPVGNFGIISLFDGVSSVVPALCQKLQQAPAVAVLAEMDPALRELVSFEFGYCPQERWKRSFAGFPAIYVKDVRRIFEKGCLILLQAHRIAPTAKWFIIGGSPCQDLTYAGPFHGLLGLTGPHSVLFFPLQRTICLMQQLAGLSRVRYLAENAGSMEERHFDAFCRLLNLDPKDRKKYIWDVMSFGAPIQRGRNFFRGHLDYEEVSLHAQYFPAGWGPLVDALGQVIPLAPLLRTRTVEAFGIHRSSWTLYQPKALVWHYEYWGDLASFGRSVQCTDGKVPLCKWEKIIPPPFQEAWKAFIDDLSKAKPVADKLDKHIQQLVPLFACSTFQIPIRIVSPFEALKLSGLESHWQHNSLQDADYMPDNLIRDMCGNSFNASLVCSALGKTSTLLDWIKEGAEPQGECHATAVASKKEAHAIYADLVSKVVSKSTREYPNKQLPVQRTLPELPDFGSRTVDVELPAIGDRELAVDRRVKVTKAQRLAQHQGEAAAKILTQAEGAALEKAELAWIFESFRAAVHATFDFHRYDKSSLGLQ